MMTDVTDANREAAETLRDGMINVARSLADRDCGATQSEMRDAQIEYLIVHREASIAPYVEALRAIKAEAKCATSSDGKERDPWAIGRMLKMAENALLENG